MVFVITILWYTVTIHLTTTWSFPDSAIGKKYILARTSNGYELVPDGSKVPGIPVSSVVAPNDKLKPAAKIQLHPTVGITTPSQHPIVLNDASEAEKKINNLVKENSRSEGKESIVTLAFQGHDGLNGKTGPKGKRGPPGLPGRQGPPGLKGKSGTCKLPQCDMNMMQSLTKRISKLERSCSLLLKDKVIAGSTNRGTNS